MSTDALHLPAGVALHLVFTFRSPSTGRSVRISAACTALFHPAGLPAAAARALRKAQRATGLTDLRPALEEDRTDA